MGVLHRVDARIGDGVRRITDRGPAADAWVRATTDLGSLFMVIPAAALLVRQGRRRTGIEVAVAGVLGWTISQQAKRSFDRPRPYQAEGTPRLIPEPTGSSMPSGHAAVAAAVATVLAAPASGGRRWPWLAMALYVPVTRVHVGVHYPGDTAVGVAIGWGLGRAVLRTSALMTKGAERRVDDAGLVHAHVREP